MKRIGDWFTESNAKPHNGTIEQSWSYRQLLNSKYDVELYTKTVGDGPNAKQSSVLVVRGSIAPFKKYLNKELDFNFVNGANGHYEDGYLKDAVFPKALKELKKLNNFENEYDDSVELQESKKVGMKLAQQVLEAHGINEMKIGLLQYKSKKTESLMKNIGDNHFEQMWNDKLEANKKEIEYCKEALSSDLEKWERKEYEGMLDIYNEEKKNILQALKNIKNMSKNEELPQDVSDKIKANNDKMSDLKASGGSEEEIDKLEKENDELNGGNKTATSESNEPTYNPKRDLPVLCEHLTEAEALSFYLVDESEGRDEVLFNKVKPLQVTLHKLVKDYHDVKKSFKSNESFVNEDLLSKYDMAMKIVARKPKAVQAELYGYALKSLINAIGDATSIRTDLKHFAQEFLFSARQGASPEELSGIELEEVEEAFHDSSKESSEVKTLKLDATLTRKLSTLLRWISSDAKIRVIKDQAKEIEDELFESVANEDYLDSVMTPEKLKKDAKQHLSQWPDKVVAFNKELKDLKDKLKKANPESQNHAALKQQIERKESNLKFLGKNLAALKKVANESVVKPLAQQVLEAHSSAKREEINGHRIDGHYQGIPYAETGSNSNGIFVKFFVNDSHTKKQIEKAESEIRNDRDVVKFVTEKVSESHKIEEDDGKAFFGEVGQFNYAVKINGLDADDLSGNGPTSLGAMKKIKDFQKDAQKTSIASKGKPNMAEIKKWVKEFKPSEFAVKWPSGNWNDDSVEISYVGGNMSGKSKADHDRYGKDAGWNK